MIRNIIFDLGNVLLSWKPDDYLRTNGYEDSHRDLIMNDIVRSREWFLLDNGDISLHEAAERIASRSSLKIPEIFAVFDLRTSILHPLHQNVKVLPELKKWGFKLYYLSNFPDDIFDEIRERYDLFRYFDGGIISARVKVSKPDPGIFRILVERYALIPEESVFIDDVAANSDAAESVGISGIHLSEPHLLKEVLQKRLGIQFSF